MSRLQTKILMLNRNFIESIINLRKEKNDKVNQIATRNKASPINKWSDFIPFSPEAFNKIFNINIDGVKLKFRYTTLQINARLKHK